MENGSLRPVVGAPVFTGGGTSGARCRIGARGTREDRVIALSHRNGPSCLRPSRSSRRVVTCATRFAFGSGFPENSQGDLLDRQWIQIATVGALIFRGTWVTNQPTPVPAEPPGPIQALPMSRDSPHRPKRFRCLNPFFADAKNCFRFGSRVIEPEDPVTSRHAAMNGSRGSARNHGSNAASAQTRRFIMLPTR